MMKRIVSAILAGLMVMALSAGAALAAEKTYKLDVVGLICIKDEIMVGAIFDRIIGVKDYKLSMMDSSAVVTIEEDDTSIEAIDAKLDKKGFGINSATEIAQ